MGQASVMTFSRFPKYPCDREVNVGKCLLKGRFYRLLEYSGTLWWLLILFFQKWRVFPSNPFYSPLFFCEHKLLVICLGFLKFYLTGFPIRCITNFKYIEATFAGHFYSFLVRLCWLLLSKVFCTLVMQEIDKAHRKVSSIFFYP